MFKPMLDPFLHNHAYMHVHMACNDTEVGYESPWIETQVQMFFGNGSFGYVCSNAAQAGSRAIQSGVTTRSQTLNRKQGEQGCIGCLNFSIRQNYCMENCK